MSYNNRVLEPTALSIHLVETCFAQPTSVNVSLLIYIRRHYWGNSEKYSYDINNYIEDWFTLIFKKI